MSDIKMSDVFDLPLTGNEERIYDNDGDTIADIDVFAGNEFAAKAINAYDANQERVEELEGFAVEADSCVGLQRTKIDEQKEEIKALMAQVELTRDRLRTLIELSLDNEYKIEGEWGCGRSIEQLRNDGLMPDEIINAEDALNKTPQQCLADVRADAELKGAKEFKSYILSTNLSKNLSGHVSGAFVLFENKLKDKAK